jgi:hypothetical protein
VSCRITLSGSFRSAQIFEPQHTPPYPETETNRRLGLVASQLGGLMIGRYILRLPTLVDMSVEELAVAIAPTLQRYIDGPVDGVGSASEKPKRLPR